jgi:hypothetical protein
MLNDFPRSRRWHARWIWLPGDGCSGNTYGYFRKEFTLENPPRNLRLAITADTYYRLFINGRLMGQGPPLSQPFFKYYDERDVDEYLRPGDNCIAVIVYHVGSFREDVEGTRGGLLAELVDGNGRTVVVTDSDWHCLRATAWRQNTFLFRMNYAFPYQEVYDARREPLGWKEIGFDDSTWPYSVVVNEGSVSDRPPAAMPWGRLVPRDIPFMTATPILPSRIERIEENLDLANRVRSEDLSIALSMPGRPIRYSRVEGAEHLLSEEGETIVQCSTNHLRGFFDGIHDPSIVLDFGRVITAYLELKLSGVAGGMVDIGYAERLIDGHFNNALEGQYADRYIMRDGEQTFRSFAWRGFRYVKLRFRSCFKPVIIRSVRAIVTTYPYEERGAFHCSDETFNAIFDICRYTVRLCSNEFLMDTPWREQGQWLGDVAAVTIPAIYACFGDVLLPGKFFRQTAANQFPTGLLANVSNVVSRNWRNTLPDYSLWWIMALWNHYLYTGEERWIHRYYPEASRIIQVHMEYVNDRGLIENVPYRPFIDWAPVDRRGECAPFNAIFYGALEAFANMARLKGDIHTLDQVDEAIKRLKGHFQERFFDPERGCFADANVEGTLSERASEHANAAAIRWGLCDEETTRKVIEKVWERREIQVTEAQPFFMVVVLNALDRANRFDLALNLIRERWGERMVARGALSTYEEWYQNGSWRSGSFAGFLRSHSHAWSACPAEFLIRNLIGLEILEPGCRKIRIRPREAPFNYSVAYPTPLGEIRVTGEDGRIEIHAPKEITII